jgi:hypothetical protein
MVFMGVFLVGMQKTSGSNALKKALTINRYPFGRTVRFRPEAGVDKRPLPTHCSPSASKISAVSCYQVAGRCRALSTIQGASEPDDAIELGQICCWVAICPLQSRTEKTSTIDVALSLAETSWERNVQTFKPASYWAI